MLIKALIQEKINKKYILSGFTIASGFVQQNLHLQKSPCKESHRGDAGKNYVSNSYMDVSS